MWWYRVDKIDKTSYEIKNVSPLRWPSLFIHVNKLAIRYCDALLFLFISKPEFSSRTSSPSAPQWRIYMENKNAFQ